MRGFLLAMLVTVSRQGFVHPTKLNTPDVTHDVITQNQSVPSLRLVDTEKTMTCQSVHEEVMKLKQSMDIMEQKISQIAINDEGTLVSYLFEALLFFDQVNFLL